MSSSSLRGPDGRILVPGYYDDVRPVSAAERPAIAGIPPADGPAPAGTGRLARTEAVNAGLNDRIMLPALNVGGLAGGRTGEGGANLIGTESSAYIDLRLVPDQTPARVRELMEAHLMNQGWHLVRTTPDSLTRQQHPRIVKVDWGDSGYPAFRTPLDLPFSRVLVQTAEESLGQPIIQQPTSGGRSQLALCDEHTWACSNEISSSPNPFAWTSPLGMILSAPKLSTGTSTNASARSNHLFIVSHLFQTL